MSTLVQARPYPDWTGTNPDYKVTRELRPLSKDGSWSFTLEWGAFHCKSVTILEAKSLTPLKLGSDYTFGGLQSTATMKATDGIYSYIKIDPSKFGNRPPDVLVDYQFVGGEYGQNVEGIKLELEKLGKSASKYYWSEVKGVPVAFPPLFHLTNAKDIIGLGRLEKLCLNIALALQSIADSQRAPDVPEFTVGADGVQKITIDNGIKITSAKSLIVISVNRTSKNDAYVGLRFNYGGVPINVKYIETPTGVSDCYYTSKLPNNLNVEITYNVKEKKNYISLRGTFTKNFLLLEQVICMCDTPKDMLYGYRWSDAPGAGTTVKANKLSV